MPIKLSVCIPTYNRARCLKEALDSIHRNIDESISDSIEVVVSDNCSTDETEDIVQVFRERLPVRYSRNPKNFGAEKNYRIALSLASGEYVWFFCDDDILVEGAINYLLTFLNQHISLAYVYYPRILADKNLTPVKNGLQPRGLEGDRVFDSGYSLLASHNNELTSLMGFLGSNIIKKNIFQASINYIDEEGMDRQWTFLRIILKAIAHEQCAVLGKPGIICRLSNSRSFTTINSQTWFDDYIALFQFAKRIGYPERTCNHAITGIINSFSKSFVVDKAKGARNDNIFDAVRKLGAIENLTKKQPWYFLSFLPPKTLNVLYRSFCWGRNL